MSVSVSTADHLLRQKTAYSHLRFFVVRDDQRCWHLRSYANQRNSAKQLKETPGRENVDENECQSEIESLLEDSESDFIDDRDVYPDYVPTTPIKKEKAFALPRRREVSGKSTGTPQKRALSLNDQLQIPSTSTQFPQNDTPLSGEQTESSTVGDNALLKRRKRRQFQRKHSKWGHKKGQKQSKACCQKRMRCTV